MRNEHELRRVVVNEMHLRRWPALMPDCTVIQILRQVTEAERDKEREALSQLPAGATPDPSPNPRHFQARFADGIIFGWERHSEATAATLFIQRSAEFALDPTADQQVATALGWLMDLPGKIVRATRIAVVGDEASAQAMLPRFAFAIDDIVSCHVGDGARIWSDFHLRDDGFGAVLVAANGMPASDLSRTVQRLQELGNYRNLALLGLPIAQRGWKVFDTIEAELAMLGARIGSAEVTDDALLTEVTGLSMELMTEAASSDFRMSATEAYGRLVEERLDDLCIRPCAGFQSLADFTQRRFQPAIRTCAAHRRRGEVLAGRTAQFISLFRTRVETRIENQNGRLLHSMERSISTQLRLQQLVEGLSVVALSYYLIGLIGYVLKGAEKAVPALPATAIAAVLVPFVVLATWFAIHRLKARIFRH
ncbi:DUF3422 family protein [Croceicoccus ponticola]|uniref:DUF3422 family protein n=1 Tax=Croceicoccus ponticola TaxID=2217664 RepID=A0A437GWR4_9SPHN|nr:DUF3422 domain-containing protein [Croceicoccus ponticola]RVQ66534.1 DUF3422 family protein [Croceicoccus ponticola]